MLNSNSARLSAAWESASMADLNLKEWVEIV